METTLGSTLIARARALTDTETAVGASDFITDEFLLGELTSAYKRLVDVILDTAGEAGLGLLATSAVLPAPFTLPVDIYRLVDVSRLVGTRWVPLEMANWRNRGDHQDTYWPRWAYADQTLRLFPPEAGQVVGDLTVWYIPTIAAIAATSDVTTVNGWDDFLVGHVCVSICMRDERDPGTYRAMVADAQARIKAAAANINIGGTRTIARVQLFREDYFEVI